MKVNYHLPTVHKTISKESPWHERLGHAGKSVIKSMVLPPSNDLCKVLNLNKIHWLPLKDHFAPPDLPVDCVHVDLVGPICCHQSLSFDKKVVVLRHVLFNESIFPELKQQDGNVIPLNVTWDAIEGQAVVDKFHAPLECSLELENQELVDEVQMSSIQGTIPTSEPELADEVLPADEISSLPPIGDQVLPPVCIKVIGPCHPTLFCSYINQQNILS
ncbi:hypothetical protein O181_039870 [Austropuccinia psidii MF-1]|uniref:GAG-pre-integrase domain-containing protein n=1 Tax=Austropuccinia psidii MF-1 TaxID=1389203 RepID=A0A9Q3HFK5_9BASI|nr:hypothetical protein [Austropuccinia psidii MF-1]